MADGGEGLVLGASGHGYHNGVAANLCKDRDLPWEPPHAGMNGWHCVRAQTALVALPCRAANAPSVAGRMALPPLPGQSRAGAGLRAALLRHPPSLRRHARISGFNRSLCPLPRYAAPRDSCGHDSGRMPEPDEAARAAVQPVRGADRQRRRYVSAATVGLDRCCCRDSGPRPLSANRVLMHPLIFHRASANPSGRARFRECSRDTLP